MIYLPAGSKHCRFCGTSTEPMPATDKRYCPNPNRQCQPLGHQRRNFCEHCGFEAPGAGVCKECQKPPLGSR